MEKYLKMLENHPLFKGIPISQCEVMKELNYKIKRYEKEEYIILAGNTITSLGILLFGKARIVREDIMGNCVIIADLSQGEIFAETFVCADIKESPVSVLAEENCIVFWIPLSGLTNSTIMGNLLKLLAGKNLYLNRKIEILSKRSIREKFMTYLNFLAQEKHATTFKIPLNRNELAQYLCVDRSALSREIAKLRQEEILNFDKNYITILREIE